MSYKKNIVVVILLLIGVAGMLSFTDDDRKELYASAYHQKMDRFANSQSRLLTLIEGSDLKKESDREKIKQGIHAARKELKGLDFWFRYLEPTVYKKLNGPLPVEWETEVFEKFEKPYKREGAGLTLAEIYLNEDEVNKDSLHRLIRQSINSLDTYKADSITKAFKTSDHFFLCNRLYLLNLAAIYTTGFECPDTAKVIPELKEMMREMQKAYSVFNQSFSATPMTEAYKELYDKAVNFVSTQPDHYTSFDHFNFIKHYINPLFLLNQKMINKYHVITRSMIDYSLNKKEISIFNKGLYNGQNVKGIFLRVTDKQALEEIDRLGKLLFYDPILSVNNERSCASCHQPTEFFTDTAVVTALQLNKQGVLPRNTPSLINAPYNHLLMLDGAHISLQEQAKAVIHNPTEMGCAESELIKKVLSCKEYKEGFKKLLKYTPTEKEITIGHLASAITFYYSKFSTYYSPFDAAINEGKELSASATKGFNLFMSKAQCATCHFVPQFNGVKPPYIGSEFEVLGVPADKSFTALSKDQGRYEINPATETAYAFRTGTVRNAAHTAPYMHNGVFSSLKEVIDFYDGGGGAGRGLKIENQTLSADSLKLTAVEKEQLIQFIQSLTEVIPFEEAPSSLPYSKIEVLNQRKPGGIY
jgi:cytochrome c peroxidase